MSEATIGEIFDSLPEQLQNDICLIIGITPDSYAEMVFNACMRLLERKEERI